MPKEDKEPRFEVLTETPKFQSDFSRDRNETKLKLQFDKKNYRNPNLQKKTRRRKIKLSFK